MGVPTEPERVTAAAVQALVATRQFGRRLHLRDELDSTNRLGAMLAQQGEPHGTVVFADRQSAGRGRLGRAWFSPPGDGLYCSVLLRPSAPFSDRLSWVPLVSAMAAARAILSLMRIEVRLKWPNDLLHGERKLGGILCESSHQHDVMVSILPTYVIVGVGINVNTPPERFPPELRDTATSLAIASGAHVNRLKLFVTLLKELEEAWDSLPSSTMRHLVQDYIGWCATIGRRVRVELPGNEQIEGLAETIAPDGSLRLVRNGQNGRQSMDIRAGDVVHVR
jgi:BirA family transcriptional regulator, biotin operon repressor / biotin---[acetyl-CoA-carboxylase] ligase